MRDDLNYLLGMDVEVFGGTDRGREPSYRMAKGKVIAIAYEPTLTIQDEEGARYHVVTSLPRIETHLTFKRVGLAAAPDVTRP